MNTLVFNTTPEELHVSVYGLNQTTRAAQPIVLSDNGELMVSLTGSSTVSLTGPVEINDTTPINVIVANAPAAPVPVTGSVTVDSTTPVNVAITNPMTTPVPVNIGNTGPINAAITNTSANPAYVTGQVAIDSTTPVGVNITNAVMNTRVQQYVLLTDKITVTANTQGVIFPDFDLTNFKIVTFFVQNNGTSDVRFTVQLSPGYDEAPDPRLYFDTSEVHEVAAGDRAVFTSMYYGNFIQVAYDSGADVPNFVAYINAQS